MALEERRLVDDPRTVAATGPDRRPCGGRGTRRAGGRRGSGRCGRTGPGGRRRFPGRGGCALGSGRVDRHGVDAFDDRGARWCRSRRRPEHRIRCPRRPRRWSGSAPCCWGSMPFPSVGRSKAECRDVAAGGSIWSRGCLDAGVSGQVPALVTIGRRRGARGMHTERVPSHGPVVPVRGLVVGRAVTTGGDRWCSRGRRRGAPGPRNAGRRKPPGSRLVQVGPNLAP